MLEFWQITVFVLVQFAFVYPLGHLILSFTGKQELSPLNFFVKLPIYLGVGMAGYATLLFIVGYLLFDFHVVLLLFGALWLLLLYRVKIWTRLNGLDLLEIRSLLLNSIKADTMVPLFLFLFSFLHFVFIAYGMGGWAPPGDSIWHGMRVSLIKSYRNISPSNISTPWNEAMSYYYPKGFYALSVAISFLTNAYPGEAVVIAATGASILIPSMLFVIVYIKTKSNFHSFIAFFMAYIAPGGNPYPMRGYGLFASYLQGVYPSFFGMMLTITFFCIVVLVDGFPRRSMFRSGRQVFLILLLVFSIAVAYYSFLSLVAFYLMVRMLLSYKHQLRRIFLFKGFLLVIAVVVPFLVAFLPQISRFYSGLRSSIFIYTWFEERWFVSYWVSPNFLYSNENGILITVAFLSTLIFVIHRIHQELSLLYMCFAVPLFLSFSYELYVGLLWFLTPFRAMIVFIALSYVIVAISLHSISKPLKQKAHNFQLVAKKIIQHGAGSRILVYALSLLLMAPLVYPSFFSLPSSAGRPVGDDYDALVWIDLHVPPNELILNDRSTIGLFLTSFTPKNVTFLPEADWPKPILDRMLESFPIFDHPENATYVTFILKKYDVKYIFVSSSDYYYDFWHGYEYAPPFERRKYSSQEILQFFDSHPYLDRVFNSTKVGVYKTIWNNVSSSNQNTNASVENL